MHIRESSDLARGSEEDLSNIEDPPIMPSEFQRLVKMILTSKDPVDVRLTSLIGLKKSCDQNQQHSQELLQPQENSHIGQSSNNCQVAKQSFERYTGKRKKISVANQEFQVMKEESKSTKENHNNLMGTEDHDSMSNLTLPTIFRDNHSNVPFHDEILP